MLKLRARQKRNLLATLLLSQGVPMLLAGDEMGNTQHGNNNAYCQDNEIAWIKWDQADPYLIAFVQLLTGLRRSHPVFRRPHFFRNGEMPGTRVHDIVWLNPDGREQRDEDWHFPRLAAWASTSAATPASCSIRPAARQELDDGFVVLMSAFHESLDFSLPPDDMGHRWEVVFDTARDGAAGEIYAASQRVSAGAALGVVLVRRGALPMAARPAVERTAETEAETEVAAAATPPEPTT